MKTNFKLPNGFIARLKKHSAENVNAYGSTITIVKLKAKKSFPKSGIEKDHIYYGYKDYFLSGRAYVCRIDNYKVIPSMWGHITKFKPEHFEKLDETTISKRELLNYNKNLLNMHW